jgi:alpha-beta hydrolase superfamily lysophospholipase
MRDLIFTAAMTCISRSLIFRDRLFDRLAKVSREDTSDYLAIRHRISSGNTTLDAVLVSPEKRPATAAVLICHGIGETVEHWYAVQVLLAQNGVASLVFDYSGYGRSTGSIDADQCERDALAAFAFLKQQVPSEPVSLLGFSLGSGIAAAITPKVMPHRLVLCASFTSLRNAVRTIGILQPVAFLMPAIWNTETALQSCPVPVLILHGEKDQLFPPRMARELSNACRSYCELIVVPAVSHNDPIYSPQRSYWLVILARLQANGSGQPASSADCISRPTS